MELLTYLHSRRDVVIARGKALEDLADELPPRGQRTPNDLIVHNVLTAMRQAEVAEANDLARQIREARRG